MTVSIFNTLSDTIIVDEQQAFQLCTVNSDPMLDGTEVIIFVTLGDSDQASDFEAFFFNPDTSMFEPIVFNEFGVASIESVIAPTACAQIIVTFNKVNEYRFQQQVVRKDNFAPLAEITQVLRVVDD
ncbi:hypothetical protein ACSVDA_21510 [Cytobacillus sp. Hm23]